MRAILILAICFVGSTLYAQRPAGVIASHPEWPQAKALEVDSVEHILAALDAVISGPGKTPRDWDRFRSLFVPDARLIPVRIVPAKPGPQTAAATHVQYVSVDDYVARLGPRLASEDFYEKVTS